MPVEDPFNRMAEIVGRSKARAVTFPAQGDGAIMWKSTAVHPLQPIQNVHQRLVRDALGKLSDKDLRDEDKKQAAETAVIEQFFIADSNDPGLYGVAADAPPTYVDQAITAVNDKLKKLIAAMDAAATAAVPPAVDPLPGFKTSLHAIVTDIEGVFDYFQAAKPASVQVDSPEVTAIADAVVVEERKIDAAGTAAAAATVGKALKSAVKKFDGILTSFCCIQMMHNIEPFYLFRLMVKYRIDSATAITTKARKEVSGDLTGLLNNNQRWIFDWLASCMDNLNTELTAIDSDNLLFFVKGGRALKYLEGDAFAGENDWDTQVVINPELPLGQWYELLRKVHNVVLARLKSYKLGFYQLMHQHSADFHQSIAGKLVGLNAAVPAPPDAAFSASCKAELIDIGIPRVDTVEAFEQWVQMKGKIQVSGGVPIPGFIYYINEYVLMIREAFAGTSISVGKTPKRTMRLHGIVNVDAIAAVAKAEKDRIPSAAIPKAVAAIDTLATDPGKRVFTVLVRQFATGYDFAHDPGFATAFDGLVDAEKGNMATEAAYPDLLKTAIDDEKGKGQAAAWRDDVCKPLCDIIGFGNYLSQQCEAHVTARSTFLLKQRKTIGALIKAIYTASVVNPDEELQIQMAVTGNFAAFLHAHYLGRLTASVDESAESAKAGSYDKLDDAIIKAFHDKIGVVDLIEVTLYCWAKDSDPATVLEAIVKPHLDAYIANPRTPQFDVQPGDPGTIYVFWPQAESLDPFKYKPVVVKFTVEKHPARWPQLSFIWGYPVLSIRDLIHNVNRHTAHTDEFGAQQRLKKTAAALVEMMTHYEYPNAGAPAEPHGAPKVLGMPADRSRDSDATIAALTNGTCHHLVIGSVQRANGTSGDYPDGMAAERKFSVVLPKPASAASVKSKLTIAADDSKDRTLDVLVVNQGHGDMDSFAGWTGDQLKTNVIDPLKAAGVRAQTIVLDTCLSASLAHVFAPLLADGGKMLCNVYSATSLVMVPDTWTSIDAELLARNAGGLRTKLLARATSLTRDSTAFVNVQLLRDPDVGAGLYYRQSILKNPGAKDRLSIVRYLSRISQALPDAIPDTPAEFWDDLKFLKDQTDRLGEGEAAVLSAVTDTKVRFDGPACDSVTRAFRARVVKILTDGAYGIQLPAPSLTGKPNIGSDSVWIALSQRLPTLLLTVTTLDVCPSCFAVYDQATKKLALDTLLTAELPARTKSFLDSIFPGSSAEIPAMRTAITSNGATLDPVSRYLH